MKRFKDLKKGEYLSVQEFSSEDVLVSTKHYQLKSSPKLVSNKTPTHGELYTCTVINTTTGIVEECTYSGDWQIKQNESC